MAHAIIKKTTQEKPADATHWSTRILAKALGTSSAMVQRVWAANGLQPHRTKTFKLSNNPHFAVKLLDVVGLYLDPPEHVLVLCADERTSIRALDRSKSPPHEQDTQVKQGSLCSVIRTCDRRPLLSVRQTMARCGSPFPRSRSLPSRQNRIVRQNPPERIGILLIALLQFLIVGPTMWKVPPS
jgi:hypothetical protein